MDNALKYFFDYNTNCESIVNAGIGGQKIEYFIQIVDIYINNEYLQVQTRIDQLDYAQSEII